MDTHRVKCGHPSVDTHRKLEPRILDTHQNLSRGHPSGGPEDLWTPTISAGPAGAGHPRSGGPGVDAHRRPDMDTRRQGEDGRVWTPTARSRLCGAADSLGCWLWRPG